MQDTVIRWQFDLTWSLLDAYLDELTDADCFWHSAQTWWTVHQTDDGSWTPDWADPEPVPAPAVTIGWLTWHICWWWEAAFAGLRGRRVPAPTEARWPGSSSGAVEAVRGLRERWVTFLNDPVGQPDMAAAASFPWADNADRTNEHVLWWVNAELMKNTAEIGQLIRIRAASAEPAQIRDIVGLPADIDPAIWFPCRKVPSSVDYLFDSRWPTWPGLMAAYCPAEEQDYRISREELPEDLPEATRYWVKGFTAGNLPAQPDLPG